MKNFISDANILPRIICVLLACCLWLYVMGEQNPIIERSYVINLEQRSLGEGMLSFNAPAKVNVRVRGSRAILGDISPESIKAFVNLDTLKVGQHTVSVVADFPQGEVVEVNPKVVHLFIDVSKEKVVPVTARVVGIPSPDLTLGRRTVTPGEVRIKGAAHRVDGVEKVVAPVDINERKEDFTAHVGLVALGVDGIEMPDVVIEPAEAAVEAKMVRQLVSTEMPVKANLTGALPYAGAKVTARLVPSAIKVTGAPSVLAKFKAFETQPISLTEIHSNTKLQVNVNVPEGVVAESKQVEVQLQVVNAAEPEAKAAPAKD